MASQSRRFLTLAIVVMLATVGACAAPVQLSDNVMVQLQPCTMGQRMIGGSGFNQTSSCVLHQEKRFALGLQVVQFEEKDQGMLAIHILQKQEAKFAFIENVEKVELQEGTEGKIEHCNGSYCATVSLIKDGAWSYRITGISVDAGYKLDIDEGCSNPVGYKRIAGIRVKTNPESIILRDIDGDIAWFQKVGGNLIEEVDSQPPPAKNQSVTIYPKGLKAVGFKSLTFTGCGEDVLSLQVNK